MAITESITLPAQPASGGVEFIPLAGNGFTAPKSMYYGNMSVTGDATGGLIQVSCTADPRFEQLLSLLGAEILQEAATGFRFSVGTPGALTIHTVGSTVASGLTGDALTALQFAPIAMMGPTFWTCRFDNVDTVVTRFKFIVYNFNIQASLKTPLSVLLASLPRAPTVV